MDKKLTRDASVALVKQAKKSLDKIFKGVKTEEDFDGEKLSDISDGGSTSKWGSAYRLWEVLTVLDDNKIFYLGEAEEKTQDPPPSSTTTNP